MRRRGFIAGSAAVLAAAPLGSRAQQPGKVPRVVHLSPYTAGDFRRQALSDGLHELGYVEGRNIAIEYIRYERVDQLPQAVAAVLAARPDIIVAFPISAVLAAKQATTTIPIVFHVTDPIGTGLVKSIARPEANLTGISLMATDIAGKRLQFLKEMVPGLTRVAAFWNPDGGGGRPVVEELATVAPKLDMTVIVREARGRDDWNTILPNQRRDGAQAFVLVSDPTITDNAGRIAAAGLSANLPGIYEFAEFPQAGGLMSYGANLNAFFRRAAYYIDRIVKGAKPADLPVEQPREFDLVINRKTAAALGLKIPEHLLVFATEIIE
jgi:putative tryptophan/tyrosine transport system substrate-binding protein